jgi:hypothetical protein
MSQAFRDKLFKDIQTNVEGRLGGTYFKYGEYRLDKSRWAGELKQKLASNLKSGKGSGNIKPFTTKSGKVSVGLFGDFKKLGDKLRKSLQNKANYQLIAPTMNDDNKVVLHYKRKDKSQKGGNTVNIEAAIDRDVKAFMKKYLRKQAMEYVHGKTGTGQFDNLLFRSDKKTIRQDIRNTQGSQSGGQGINVDQAIGKAIDKCVIDDTNYHVFSTIVDYYNNIFGYDHKVASLGPNGSVNKIPNALKEKVTMRGSLDTKHAADNAATYDQAILEDAKAFITGYDEAFVNEILKRLKKASPADWKGIGPKKMKDLWANSPGPVDKLDKLGKAKVIETFLKKINTKPDLRLKVNRAILAQAVKKTSGGASKFKGKKGYRSSEKKGARARASSESRVQQKAGTNPLALKNMLNQLLPVAIASNMTSPALNYRTGRFANSVRVDNVTQGPRGGNTMIDASYRNNPYETFAPGGDKYTPQRNPERLIKRTLREVATSIIGAKFGVNIR